MKALLLALLLLSSLVADSDIWLSNGDGYVTIYENDRGGMDIWQNGQYIGGSTYDD